MSTYNPEAERLDWDQNPFDALVALIFISDEVFKVSQSFELKADSHLDRFQQESARQRLNSIIKWSKVAKAHLHDRKPKRGRPYSNLT